MGMEAGDGFTSVEGGREALIVTDAMGPGRGFAWQASNKLAAQPKVNHFFDSSINVHPSFI
ncbi:hypothetical protein COW36_11450 [bacterium (Candidatus Blackallbacteria) CG17_big_fil_post_rev_8_21_14_2_50_48_46]|uniref:Uncharacterized protein n=1 Tax=bacterium (Candidatus Blackallbacteria) CG17_big_fil_post_rev_8_21_14_2_50_48_46 TaxID=2014261 RepID=A0A2M7G4T2_9BACT|nr:MAG: hypothetical protein COW64_18545 [bacterium (Candidatus Blackallbacteria) CG18_big_fil_WC_8_21_14_2_50_49_26]PIW16890.1 MAG: hypothetical protein COW36_11450 [bacterium (Candidatus Blackallbacteria) CG17_big_fil_post_rev_8_21_14_2_50_48_46]